MLITMRRINRQNRTPVQVPAGTGKKPRATRKKPAVKGFFGLLPDWKMNTQALKDELRDSSLPSFFADPYASVEAW
jgi:hypothetical protein